VGQVFEVPPKNRGCCGLLTSYKRSTEGLLFILLDFELDERLEIARFNELFGGRDWQRVTTKSAKIEFDDLSNCEIARAIEVHRLNYVPLKDSVGRFAL